MAAAILLLAAACGRATVLGYDDGSQSEPDDGNGGATADHPSEVSVAYLRSLAATESTAIDRPLSISAAITANDAFGEYFMTLHVEDETGGVDVLVGSYRLYALFPLYDRVRIECHGLALARYGSRIELGFPPAGEYAADRIPESEIGRYISVIGADGGDEGFVPVEAEAGALEPSLVGRTVIMGPLHIAGDSGSWCDTDPELGSYIDTERMAEDRSGNRITLTLRGGCLYAGERMPDGEFTVCGVVEYRTGEYALRITNRGIIIN